ncbi:pseudouridine synthase [Falsihalocynthiibacter arcticus]|uniref:Pseudouridine synthase n=1 Tax=Falsihalocynthiibacter arcticus TaxID=1579316 RepID=A0A126V578_9RHOB|nr:pseudouridine synthase [Falsihalocynthiibacter arcticus]AML53491.1 pseudouridine synthase [Falsihalocynthiibacter arcticus]
MENSSEKTGERIAKIMARAGVASRREVERMIEAGRVSVNGTIIESPALNVTGADKICVDDQPISEPEHARLWLYYKPLGLVTSNSDEKDRETVFDTLPVELGRVLSVGRLDINSEGLLLLTNDGGIKRKLELPTTGWLRRYRVRVNGRPTEETLAPLRAGIVVDGEKFQPMNISLDRQQGANAWLTVSIREGKNREVRRALAAVGLTVNRLLRVSYGPFRLGELKPGEIEEVKTRVLRDQLGQEPLAEEAEKPRIVRQRKPVGKMPRHGTELDAPASKGPRGGGKRTGKPADKRSFPDRSGGKSAPSRPSGKPHGKPRGR